ncbi:hypothetical protein PSEUBRA_000144 [Kalmanozyma brasiliensis GHG001]|uniref:Uncharacterized protein n=1 Tax=Kalmanozyma brasiliensis (strain GHG001) TaxID=1365824 RepID=V5EGT2_KALBG|nr:uncharacterized protein PSEUBRA_000144 [Kalmanozyma brasiliensis GHG001]EST09761.1 hypothetical protein PSEUBRA_000144 [Kalmanozyma brasiliensis GHG001]
MSSSSSLLFSDLHTAMSSYSMSSGSRPYAPRQSSFSTSSTYSRDSWCSVADSDVSISSTTTHGHASNEQEAFDHMMKNNITNNAIFGSTSPRKSKSYGMRSSTDSARSWTSSSTSSVRSPLTPSMPLFSHPEHDVTKTPTLPTIALPMQPKVRKPHLVRLVSDEVQYIGRSLDVPVSEEGHLERVVVPRTPSIASSRRPSAPSMRFSTWSGKDGLKLAMDELEEELARTMVTLSTNTTPNTSISRARGKSSRRPRTAESKPTVNASQSMPMSLAELAGSMSAASASDAHFQRESWMSSTSNEDRSLGGIPIRFSASDLDESAEMLKQLDAELARPISRGSVASSTSSRASRNSPGVPALVFDGRLSGSSKSSSGEEAPASPDSFVTAENGHFALSSAKPMLSRRPTIARSSSKQGGGLYQLSKGARSTPSLASSAPPRDPLPPLPSMPAGLNLLFGGASLAPPRPSKSSARSSISSGRTSPVPFTHKPLPPLPC